MGIKIPTLTIQRPSKSFGIFGSKIYHLATLVLCQLEERPVVEVSSAAESSNLHPGLQDEDGSEEVVENLQSRRQDLIRNAIC
jgi:hypothetical protein